MFKSDIELCAEHVNAPVGEFTIHSGLSTAIKNYIFCSKLLQLFSRSSPLWVPSDLGDIFNGRNSPDFSMKKPLMICMAESICNRRGRGRRPCERAADWAVPWKSLQPWAEQCQQQERGRAGLGWAGRLTPGPGLVVQGSELAVCPARELPRAGCTLFLSNPAGMHGAWRANSHSLCLQAGQEGWGHQGRGGVLIGELEFGLGVLVLLQEHCHDSMRSRITGCLSQKWSKCGFSHGGGGERLHFRAGEHWSPHC